MNTIYERETNSNNVNQHAIRLENGDYASATTRENQIEIYAHRNQITRIAIIFDLAGWTMIDRQTSRQQPDMQAVMFRKE